MVCRMNFGLFQFILGVIIMVFKYFWPFVINKSIKSI